MKKKQLKSIPIAKANMEVMHDIAVSGKGKRGVITVQNVKMGQRKYWYLMFIRPAEEIRETFHYYFEYSAKKKII